jgi:prolyl-tRNA synthetase
MENNKNSKALDQKITPRSEDYSQWYLDIISVAELADYGPVKGTMIIKPYGYAIWETTQKILDEKFKETDVQNAYFPLFIPEKLLKKEESHIEGFAPEVAVVTHAGGKKLEEPIIVRPTSETIMYDSFSNWISSYRDLPLLINQWANVVRWELRTKLFLRTTEFLWQEGHTVHETHDEADSRALQMLDIYKDFAENYMAIPVIPGTKTDSEKFAGALKTYCVEAMMQDGKALQYATSHNLGQNFSKVFDVSFLDRNNERQFGWQTSWGLSTRTIGGLIMVHSDDKGLVLPPKIATTQVVVTVIYSSNKEENEELTNSAKKIQETLKAKGIRCQVDIRDIRPGEKFFEWERKGVPIRVELGIKDIANKTLIVARRDTGEKILIPYDSEISTSIAELLDTVQHDLYQKALTLREDKTKMVDNWNDFVDAINSGNFVLAHWSGDSDIEAAIKEETGATIRCIPFSSVEENGFCVKSGKTSSRRVLFAKSY